MFGRRSLALPQPPKRRPPPSPRTRRRCRPAGGAALPTAGPATPAPRAVAVSDRRVEALKSTHARIQAALYDRIDATAATKLPRDELNRQILELIAEVVAEQRLSLHGREQEAAGRHHRRQHGGPGPARAAAARRDRSPTSW